MDQTMLLANMSIETKQTDQGSMPSSQAIAVQRQEKSDESLKSWLDLLDSWNIYDEVIKLNESLSEGFLCLARDKYHNSWKYVSLRDMWWSKLAKSGPATSSTSPLSVINPDGLEEDGSSPNIEMTTRWKIVFIDDEQSPGKQKMQLIDTSNPADGNPIVPGFGVLHSDMVRRAQKGFEEATKQAVILASYAFNLSMDQDQDQD
mmetsp:Transcript_15505/g.27215  ORF Transcript_15505/g.27215 Transcript_15505/m.27215 type:complete len:204 (+) Transcript_15505:92-703(+)